MRALLFTLSLTCAGCAYNFDEYLPSEADANESPTDSGASETFDASDSGDVDGTATDSETVDTGGSTDDTPVACTEDGSKQLNGHCYFALPQARYDKAVTDCSSRGAHLVTITSAEEQALVQTLRSGRNRWIGLRRPPGSPSMASSFVWVTGEPVGYTNWESSEPNGTGECARLRTGNDWADSNCNDMGDVLCERE